MAVLLLLASGAVWVTLRRHASVSSGAVPPDPTEARLRQEAARAPGDPRPCSELGEHYLAQGRGFSAVWEYQEALARQAGEADARLGFARSAMRVWQFDTAAAALASLLRSESTLSPARRVEAARTLIGVYLHTARPQKAVAALRLAAAALSDLDRARVYRAAGQFPAAEAAYRRALRAPPEERDALRGLAQLYLEWDHPEAAIRLLTDPGRQRVMDANTWLWLGKAYAAQQDGLGQAMQCTEKAREYQPQSAPIAYQAGLLLRRSGDRAGAAEQFAQALRFDPRYPEAHRALAETLRTLGHLRPARRELAAYYELREQPDRVIAVLTADHASPVADVETAARTVLAYTLLHQPERAEQVWEQALREHPGDPDLLSQATLIQLMAGSRDALEALCQRWERADPASGDPAWLRGRRAFAEAHTAEAIRLFEAAVAREPRRPGFCASLGVAYTAVPTAENRQRAIVWLKRAIDLDPNDAGTRGQLGELLARAGQPEVARRELLLSLDLDPQQVGAMNSLVQLCATLRRPTHAGLLRTLVRSLETQKRDQQRLRRQLRAHPEDVAARGELARALAGAGLLTAARDQWERAAEERPDRATRRALANVERLLQVLRG